MMFFYQWDFEDGEISNEQKPNHINTNAGNYTVEITVTIEQGLESKNSTYATIYLQTNYQNNPGGKGIPGFEIIILIITISFIINLKKINNKKEDFN